MPVERFLGFRGHIVLIVLSQHLVGCKAFAIPMALGDRALTFLKEVGQDAAIADGQSDTVISNGEVHGNAIRLALQAAWFDQTPNTYVLAGADFPQRTSVGV